MKTVLFSGGARGVGRAIADHVARAGHRVIVTSRTGAPIDGLRVMPLEVTDPAASEALFSKLDAEGVQVDVLVNNAGVGYFGPLLEVSAEAFAEMLRVNVLGAYALTQAALRRMKAGRIVNIGSIADARPIPGNVAYGATKWALRGMSETLQAELAGSAITVSHVSLGAVYTEIWAGREGFDPKDMLPLGDVARVLGELILTPPSVRIDHLSLYPPKGVL